MKTVADDAGVSEAMIVKIAKKLGFAGFKDFRAGIVGYNRLPTAELHQELSPDDTGVEIAQKVFRTSIHALEETLSILDPEAFEKAADLIFTARQRDFYGIGGSAQIARDVSHKFLRIGVRTSVFDDAHMMLMSAAPRGRGRRGRLLAFGNHHRRHRALELARRRGARTIALTNYATSPLASIADVVLCSTAQGSPLLGENAAARIAQLIIFDAVFVAVAQRDLKAAERNLAATRMPSPRGAPHEHAEQPVVVVVGSLHYDIMVDAPTGRARARR